jgi:8-oxo-dGTP pyrophosphatase MutT (NUDIX family)
MNPARVQLRESSVDNATGFGLRVREVFDRRSFPNDIAAGWVLRLDRGDLLDCCQVGCSALDRFCTVTTGVQKPVRVLPRKRAVATMLFTDPDGRVLVVKPTYKPRWELPGGAVEDGESPGTAASREVAEELGINRVPGVLLAVDYVPADAVRTEGLIVVFDGGTIDDPGMLRLPADELSGWAFVAPDQLGDYLPALQARRAAAGS